ncbi:phage tail protein [Carnobacteriaceae bacterium zg-ZUI252]|nr:phage tail protein [Carnobacteriaceae bacterium zg-ZUI252]
MAKIVGLEEVYIFPITKMTGDVPTYGQVEKLARGIDVTLSPKVAEATLYAGDVLDESVSSITGYDITMNINQLTPAQRAKLLGHSIDSKGMISVGPNDTAPEFAVAFSSPTSDGHKEYRVMYRVKFKPSDESFKTKSENIEFQTPTITGVSFLRGDIQKYSSTLRNDTEEAKAITDNWFQSVQVPAAG